LYPPDPKFRPSGNPLAGRKPLAYGKMRGTKIVAKSCERLLGAWKGDGISPEPEAAGLMAAGLTAAGLMAAGLMAAGLTAAGLMAAGLVAAGLMAAGLMAAGLPGFLLAARQRQ
jgi:hypothetical protein